MQRLIIAVLIIAAVAVSYKIGLVIAANNIKSIVLQELAPTSEMKNLQNTVALANESKQLNAAIFIELETVQIAHVGIDYKVLDDDAAVLQSEPHKYYYTVSFDKKTKKIQQIVPYSQPVN